MFFITRSRTAQAYSHREVVSTNGAETRGEKTGNGDAGGLEEGKIGWGGRIRTFTVLINSEVSYQLDHAPAGFARLLRGGPEPAGETCKAMKNIKSIAWPEPSARAE